MAWKVSPVESQRFLACHAVRTLGRPVAAAARESGVSRKTLHKWLAVFDAAGERPSAADLADRSRAPRHSPRRTPDAVEAVILSVRDDYHWGPRKIHAHLRHEGQALLPLGGALPAARTVADVLRRRGRVPAAAAPDLVPPPQRFERSAPNQLWQLDHKGPVEVGQRQRVTPLTVQDDHSRWCLALEPLTDRTMASAWTVLWRVFAEVGLPEQVLCDNAFGTMGTDRPAGVSWFDARLIRLGIVPSHGRPYHPQTQGKVERLHGSIARELLSFNARRDSLAHFAEDCQRWRDLYNTLRPHEALGDRPPITRYAPSPRPRPACLPEARGFYPAGSELRRVSDAGHVSLDGRDVLLGKGIAGEAVRVERRDREVAIFYCAREVRCLSHDQLVKGKVL